MRTFILLILLAAGGCQPANVYDRPMPAGDDSATLNAIRDALKPEDRDAWAKIVMRKINPASTGVASKTVGEAIAKMKVMIACIDANDIGKADPNNSDRYNLTVQAYNECLKLPV